MSDAAAEVFRSPRRAACDERAFVLAAVGISSEMAADGAEFLLQVSPGDAPEALLHLQQYELELARRPIASPPAPLRLHPNAWVGSLIYTCVLLGVAYSASSGLWRLDAFDAGELDAARVQGGQWWRVWTALTLHLNGPHLAANTGAGIWFGYLAGRLIGAGNAWLLVVLGAGFANWVEAYFGPATHRAVGASTAVFTALGLLSAYSWKTRFRFPQRWAARWGPLIAGVILLGWTGTGGGDVSGAERASGEGIDIVAHALGFAIGLLLGATVAWPPSGRVMDRLPQWLMGLLALAPLVVAWISALNS